MCESFNATPLEWVWRALDGHVQGQRDRMELRIARDEAWHALADALSTGLAANACAAMEDLARYHGLRGDAARARFPGVEKAAAASSGWRALARAHEELDTQLWKAEKQDGRVEDGNDPSFSAAAADLAAAVDLFREGLAELSRLHPSQLLPGVPGAEVEAYSLGGWPVWEVERMPRPFRAAHKFWTDLHFCRSSVCNCCNRPAPRRYPTRREKSDAGRRRALCWASPSAYAEEVSRLIARPR